MNLSGSSVYGIPAITPTPMRLPTIWILVLLLPPVQGVGQAGTEQAIEEQRPQVVTEPCQGGWAVPSFPRREGLPPPGDRMRKDARGQLNNLRMERNIILARNAGTVPPVDQARLVDLAADLNAASPNTFEAHMANYYVRFPAPSAFEELQKAMPLGGGREELLAPQLLDAARRDDVDELARKAIQMKMNGRVAPSLSRLAEDIMDSVEPGSILFSGGEMDAIPLWVEQYANGKHKDLLVVDERLLADPVYRARIWARCKARGGAAGHAGFIPALASATDKPVYLSLSLGRELLAPLREKLYVTGLAMRYSGRGMDNIPLLVSRWDRLKKPMDAGPLSRNYLVPGAVLLEHYRAIGDEKQAALLEQELRMMAQRLGATSTLVKCGILQH